MTIHDAPPAPQREDILTRRAARLAYLEHERRGYRIEGIVGAAALLAAGAVAAFAFRSLRQGSVDVEEAAWIIHAGNEPGLFYAAVAWLMLIACVTGWMGVRILQRARQQARRISRHVGRLARVGKGEE